MRHQTLSWSALLKKREKKKKRALFYDVSWIFSWDHGSGSLSVRFQTNVTRTQAIAFLQPSVAGHHLLTAKSGEDLYHHCIGSAGCITRTVVLPDLQDA